MSSAVPVPVSNALQSSVGRFCFYRKLASMFPPPSTDHGLISSNIKEGGNIDVQSRNAFTYQVSSVSGGTVTLSGDMITPSSIVAFTFEVTALTIGARWTGVCTNSSLKCQHFSTNQSATSARWVGMSRCFIDIIDTGGRGKQWEETTKHGQWVNDWCLAPAPYQLGPWRDPWC